MSLTAQKGKWMIYLSDSQNSWDFSKPSELCWPELSAGVWAAHWHVTLLPKTGPRPALGMGVRRYLYASLWGSPYPLVLFGGCVHSKASLSG